MFAFQFKQNWKQNWKLFDFDFTKNKKQKITNLAMIAGCSVGLATGVKCGDKGQLLFVGCCLLFIYMGITLYWVFAYLFAVIF